ncbi:hypothetical protein P3T37_001670 [Kitasatospora sp. MAA4]|uniref:hypothetical protein n=1 Tax=Kitasatospora sp. MAA4 TaxID=3035093 RepID=UPI002474D134|nr:hypothetical protein [Kitasatospora sp. MAA4]MDH6132285.1 hypothetical protein [Kitasatospora sp. MAA4]
MRSIQRIDPLAANLPQVWELPAGTTVQQVEESLTALQERHEALQTRYENLGSESPAQIILAPQPVTIASSPQESDPVKATDSLGADPLEGIS